jgi:hypothetical protein
MDLDANIIDAQQKLVTRNVAHQSSCVRLVGQCSSLFSTSLHFVALRCTSLHFFSIALQCSDFHEYDVLKD